MDAFKAAKKEVAEFENLDEDDENDCTSEEIWDPVYKE